MNEEIFFLSSIKWKQQNLYVIWVTNGFDHVLCEPTGRIPLFRTYRDAKTFSESRRMSLEKESIQLDLDNLSAWLETSDPSAINCNHFLNCWNFLDDCLSGTRGKESHLEEDRYIDVYNKLFAGCNLPSVNRSGKKYSPEWEEEELMAISTVFRAGLELFQERVEWI